MEVPQEIEFSGFQQNADRRNLNSGHERKFSRRIVRKTSKNATAVSGRAGTDERGAMVTFSDVISLRSPLSNDDRTHNAMR